ncbi:MAG: histidinol phosphatase, partial [Clostridia bacterium]|nr:histidinol phosphatase [Clostridia bacterium]
YNYVAHPDLFGRLYHKADADYIAVSRDICAAAKQLNIPLEYNLLGLEVYEFDRGRGGQGYPCEAFWEVAADTGCLAIIGFDAHHGILPAHIEAEKKAFGYLTGLGMQVVGDLEI